MSSIQGKNHILIKRENTALIKSVIYKYGPISRAEISDLLGLTPPTITNIINDLLRQGVVHEIPMEATQKRDKVGRKPIGVDFIHNSRFSLGISLGRSDTHLCLIDIKGNILYQKEEVVMPKEYDAMLQKLKGMIEEVKDRFPEQWEHLIGIGISVPHLVDAHKGVIRNTNRERMDWSNRCLSEALKSAFHKPVRIENNVRSRTSILTVFQPELLEDCDTFVLCHASIGIAAPLILKNQNVRGEGGAAGEIGHMIMNPEETKHGGTLEEYASVKAILRDASYAMEYDKAPILKEMCKTSPLTIEQIFAARNAGDQDVKKILDKVFRYLGIALANIVDFMNPQLIFLSGPLFKQEEDIQVVKDHIYRYSFVVENRNVLVKKVDFGAYGGAMGAAAACIEKYFVREEI